MEEEKEEEEEMQSEEFLLDIIWMNGSEICG